MNDEGKAQPGAKEVKPEDVKLSLVSSDGSTDASKPTVLGNVAEAEKGTDAVNKNQLDREIKKAMDNAAGNAGKGNNDLYENATDKDGNVVDAKGNPLVQNPNDGKWYPKNPDGTPNTGAAPVEPARVVKTLKFVGDSGDQYESSLDTPVAIYGQDKPLASTEGYVAKNVATKTTDKGLQILFSETPEFKAVTLKDEANPGNGTKLDGKGMTVTNGKGASTAVTAEGIALTGPKGADGKDGVTKLITIDGDGDVAVRGENGEGEEKLVTNTQLEKAITNAAPNADAVNKLVDNRVGALGKQVTAAGANSAALSAMVPLDYDEEHPTIVTAGYGYFGGSSSLALGLMHYVNRDFLVNAGAAFGAGETSIRLGASLRLGNSPKYENRRVNTHDYALLKRVETQEKTLAEQAKLIQEMQKELAELKKGK